MPRELTLKEVRSIFIENLRAKADYWATIADKTPHERCHGLVFSILATLDGVDANGCPGFKLISHIHEGDKEHHHARGINWFPAEDDIRENVMMHDEY